MKILVADDHAIVRKGLIQLIRTLPNVGEVSEAANGFEVLEKIEQSKYNLVVLDLSMPGKNGLDTLKDIIKKDPKSKVLILSVHPEEQYAIRSFNSGASGYITKNSAPRELLKAIEQVLNGKKYITTTLAEKLINLKNIEKPLHKNLTDREFQIMIMSAEGFSISKIAKELSISPKTVSSHRSKILDKMNFDNFAQVTHYVIANNL